MVMLVASTVVFGVLTVALGLSTMPLGMVLVGPLADRFTVESVLVGSALAAFLVVALALTVPSGRLAVRAARR